MNGNIDICIYRHKDLDDATIEKIAQLKKQWWHYPLAEQIRYLKNLPYEDQHILGLYENRMVAYLRLTERMAKIKDTTYQVAGISTVCTDKALLQKGLGHKIMEKASQIIDEKPYDFGLLECDDSFVEFYEKCGWHQIQCYFFCRDEASSKLPLFREKNNMMYPQRDLKEKEIEIIGGLF